jgi:hypothetical protein
LLVLPKAILSRRTRFAEIVRRDPGTTTDKGIAAVDTTITPTIGGGKKGCRNPRSVRAAHPTGRR